MTQEARKFTLDEEHEAAQRSIVLNCQDLVLTTRRAFHHHSMQLGLLYDQLEGLLRQADKKEQPPL